MEGKPRVTITGITGYLGAQVCLHFLKDGGYAVRGTVRDMNNAAKMEPLKVAFGEYYDQMEFKEADLLNEDSMIAAMEGSDYIVHTASPFPIEAPKDENVLIKPAVQGTLAACKAAQINKVKKLVITSSVAAIMDRKDKKNRNFGPEDWSEIEIQKPYSKSKTLAEKAAWDFVAALPDDEKFDLVIINPGLILGPNLNKCNFSSGDIMKKILLN